MLPTLPDTFVLQKEREGTIRVPSPDFYLTIGKSTLPNGGLGLFLTTGAKGIPKGGRLIDYYAGTKVDTEAEGTRLRENYTMSWNGHIVSANEDCFSAYMNDNFAMVNTFVDTIPTQIEGSTEAHFPVILIAPVPPDSTIELFTHYGKQFWDKEQLSLLPPETAKAARTYYNIRGPKTLNKRKRENKDKPKQRKRERKEEQETITTIPTNIEIQQQQQIQTEQNENHPDDCNYHGLPPAGIG